jgi:hypothetical protein
MDEPFAFSTIESFSVAFVKLDDDEELGKRLSTSNWYEHYIPPLVLTVFHRN